jgi:hypothetical protein
MKFTISKNSETHKKDMIDVCEWMGVKSTKDLRVSIKWLSIDLFIQQINEMENTYDEYPKDKKRTQKIYQEILNTKILEPIYIDEKDPQLFIMEGRHRMVAFKWLDIKQIPVAEVSIKLKPTKKLKITL